MRLRSILPILAIAAFAACSGSDSESSEDDDGGGEEGTEEVGDADGDGLDADEEAELGTDPDKADTDGDGFDDKEEVDADTDPTDCEDVPEGWQDCSGQAEADGVEGTGWAYGDIMPDWSGEDQFGEEIDAYQFYGQIIVMDFSAGWCSPCRYAAETAEEVWEKHADDGVMFMHVVVDDNNYGGGVTDDEFHVDWAEEYGLSFPVILDQSESGYSAAYVGFDNEGYISGIPFYAIVGRDMEVITTWTGASDSQLNSEIREAKRLYE